MQHGIRFVSVATCDRTGRSMASGKIRSELEELARGASRSVRDILFNTKARRQGDLQDWIRERCNLTEPERGFIGQPLEILSAAENFVR